MILPVLKCPPVANRGIFKFITLLIPVKECYDPKAPTLFYWICHYLNLTFWYIYELLRLVPFSTILSYVSSMNLGSSIVSTALSKYGFLVNFAKPILEKVMSYLSNSEESRGVETQEVEERSSVPFFSFGKKSGSFIRKESEPTDNLSINYEVSPPGESLLTKSIKPFIKLVLSLQELAGGTKDKCKSSFDSMYKTVASSPTWFYLYVLSVLFLIGYLAFQTYQTYKGRLWYMQHKISDKIREGCKDLILSDTSLKEMMVKLRAEIDKGLNPSSKGSSTVKCFTTYVQDLPAGNETGRFLALDLGGTNFRVLLITLNGKHFDMQSKIYAIPQEVMVGTSQNLFSHIAQCLLDFTREHKVNNEKLPLGFTFSFPLAQEGLTKGILQRWTKGFSCPEAVGRDVVELLNEAIESHNDLKIDIMAILNDTTGTLMSCAWKNHNTKIGVILGTGTNACYVEKIENVIGFDGDRSKAHVLVNTEWGAFGDHGELEYLRTPFDKQIDTNSINPGSQLFEKLISGMYLGEIVRLLLVKFIADKLIFDGKLSNEIQQKEAIPTKFLSEVESDKRGIFKNCRKYLSNIGYNNVSDEDCNSVRFVCECVSRRAAHLASAGLATLINKMGYTSLTIGVDGSLYRFHPHFHDLMVEKISQLIDDKVMEFGLMLSSDGSGRGAALVAASAKILGK